MLTSIRYILILHFNTINIMTINFPVIIVLLFISSRFLDSFTLIGREVFLGLLDNLLYLSNNLEIKTLYVIIKDLLDN